MLACTDLLEATKVSMDLNPITTLIENMHDVKKWITPHLNDLHGHRDPHCFKFVCNEDDKCMMFFRNWTCDPWCPEDKATVVLKARYLNAYLYCIIIKILMMSSYT